MGHAATSNAERFCQEIQNKDRCLTEAQAYISDSEGHALAESLALKIAREEAAELRTTAISAEESEMQAHKDRSESSYEEKQFVIC